MTNERIIELLEEILNDLSHQTDSDKIYHDGFMRCISYLKIMFREED